MFFKKFLFAITFISIAIAISIAGYWYFQKPNPALAAGNIINATSCSYTDVSATITSASTGDTVTVPAGSCVWSNSLVITKGITLQGSGVSNLTIISNIVPPAVTNSLNPGNYLINYRPDSYSISNNIPFRVTGFKFDLNYASAGILLYHRSSSGLPITNVRIDNNEFINTPTSFSTPGIIRNIRVRGSIHGVIDHNIFNGRYSLLDIDGDSDYTWSLTTPSYGSANALYIENNNFTLTNNGDLPTLHGEGAITVFRYNTYNINLPLSSCMWIDAHGNQPGPIWGTMQIEMYGNLLTGSCSRTPVFLDARGGRSLVFWNGLSGAFTDGAIQTREEFDDSISPPFSSPITGQPQHVFDSYWWNNRYSSSQYLFRVSQLGSQIIGDIPLLDRDYFVDARALVEIDQIPKITLRAAGGSFNGASGVGCGTLSSRPATCTTGVGYWATDQSCSNVDTANVGANPTTPISGTLYKCTTPNTWIAYYTPYAYPHPLTMEASPPLKGDFNSDSKVNNLDFTSFKNAFFSIFNSLFDLNSDSAIDVKDLGVLMSGWLP